MAETAKARVPALRDRPRCIDIKSKLVLSPEGVRFFTARNLGLHRFETPDGDARYGFKLRSVDVPWLRRLLRAGFVEKAEFPVRDLGSVKSEIGDLARLSVFAMHYGFFRSVAFSRVMQSEVIHRWNRAHPHQALDSRSAAAPVELKNALRSRTSAVEALQRELSAPILRSIAVDGRRSDDEKRSLSFFVEELAASADPLVYFVLLCCPESERLAIGADLAKAMAQCVERYDLADFLSLMTLEIMGAAERSTLIESLGSDVRPSEVRARLENPETRSRLMAELPNGLASAMVWSISTRWALGRRRYRLRLSLHDGSSSFEDSKRLFDERGRLALGDRNLLDLYEHGSGPYGDDGLGWYYLSFIAEACKHMGVPFEASVLERPGRGTAAVNLALSF